MNQIRLKTSINRQQIAFYLKSCKYYRFPFFDPHNYYRQDSLFGKLEDALFMVGEKISQEYGENFISINLRGSWLRGIPAHGDDIDVLFVVSGLSQKDKDRIQGYTREALKTKNDLFIMCEGKVMKGVKVDPIIFLDLSQIDTIMNKYMYGLTYFIEKYSQRHTDAYQDSYFGYELAEKKAQFLKSGILIPYVGWIYGRDRKREVFSKIAEYLPIPTRDTSIFKRGEIEEAKETIRQAFIAHNLIFPSLEVKKLIDLKTLEAEDLKQEAIEIYQALEPLEDIYARAVVNYIYTLKIEEKLLGGVLSRDRIKKFASTYDKLVDDILKMTYLRLAVKAPPGD